MSILRHSIMVVIAGYPCIQLSKICCPRPILAGYKLVPRARGPKALMVEMIGIEPTTSGLQSRRSPN